VLLRKNDGTFRIAKVIKNALDRMVVQSRKRYTDIPRVKIYSFYWYSEWVKKRGISLASVDYAMAMQRGQALC